MADLSLVFDVLARDNASGTFRNVGDSAERAGKQTSGFGTQMAGAMKIAAGALLGAGLIEGFKNLYQAADESRKIAALTTQVIKTTGGAANVSAKQVGELAGAIAKKTGVDDEAIQSGQNLLLTFTNVRNEVGKGNNIFDQATQTITDMSVALGQDTSSSAIQLGKALNDPIKGVTALQRVGVSFTASQKDQIRTLVESGQTLEAQKIILAELGKEFGGAAEAASTPLGKLQQRAGDLAEQIGGYLVPIVDKAATFFSEKLLPAFSDAGSIIGGTVVPAFKLIATVVGTVADVFNALPGPLQAGVLALGAFLVLRGPVTSLFTGIADGVTNMALKMASSVGAANGFKGAISNLVGSISPVTLGIGAVTLALPFLIESFKSLSGVTDRAKAAQQTFADVLRETNGVIDETTRAGARKALIDSGIVDVLNRAGVASKDAIDGLLGNAAAQDRVNHGLNDYLKLNPGTAHNAEAESIRQAREGYEELAGTFGLTTEQAKYFADAAVATGVAAAGTVPEVDEATAALEAWLGQLQGIGEGFVQPLSTYQELLSQKKEAERTSAEATAAATASSKDSWEDYVKDVGVSLDEYATKLEEQLTAQDNWRQNIGIIAQRGGVEVAQALAAMGVEGVQLAAQMANGTDAEFQRMAELLVRDAQQGGAGAAAALDTQMKVMAAIGGAGAGATRQAIADQLGISVTEVQAIADQYGVALATGINPILAGIGKQVITVNQKAGRRYVGLNEYFDGGFTGPGGKYTPAGVVHAGEFVFPQESVKRLGVDFLGAMAGLPGYAGGGFVSPSDVPRPPSSAPTRPPISTAADGVMQKGFDEVKAWLTANAMFSGGPAGAGVQRWLPLVLRALGMVGQPAGLAQTVLRRMQQESGGNPMAINNWDINAKRGTPSKGLMQTIDPTFRAYAMPGYNSNVYDPLSNILASMRYAMSRYGSLSAAYNKAGGYELGTDWVPETGSYVLHKGEAVVPAAANSGWTGGNLSGVEITGTLEIGGDGLARIVDGRIVSAFNSGSDWGGYHP